MQSDDRGSGEVGRMLGRITSVLPGGGERRAGQAQMARFVERAIESERHLIVQAGTGTGKSLAYLLPAARAGRRVVIATATKALQDQLATKDLPFLARQLGPDVDLTYRVLKGRSNYLCRQRALEVTTKNSSPEGPEPMSMFDQSALQAGGTESGFRERDAGLPVAKSQAEAERRASFTRQLRLVLSWGEATVTGDRTELDFEPHAGVWASVSVGPRECPGAFRCPSGAQCFAERARDLAASADIVVVNTHLYATDVATGRSVLPEHDVVVFDEAHAVEDVMTDGLGIELGGNRLRSVALASRQFLRDDDSSLADRVTDTASMLDRTLRDAVGRRVLAPDAEPTSDRSRHSEVGLPSREVRDVHLAHDSELEALLTLARGRLEALVGALRRSGGDQHDDEGGGLTRCVLSVGHLLEDIGTVQSAGDEYVVWVETDGQAVRSPVLRLAPIEVGTLLAERLWPKVTAVLTSATIPPLLSDKLGLPAEETDLADVGSPFPFSECALLYCPTDLPDRRDTAFESAMHDELFRIMTAAGGRTLGLFTSWRAMRAATEALRPRLPFTLLSQSDLPKPRLIEAFTNEESSCLFATMSFWQGVDVPGATLSVVAIDRLPFPRPDHPLVQARRERAGPGAFGTIDVPRAAMLLAQGAGRLIRSSEDSGMVAVLDRRLATASYGEVLRSALPPMRFTTKREEAHAFLAEMQSVVELRHEMSKRKPETRRSSGPVV